jgi:hypothetical protein
MLPDWGVRAIVYVGSALFLLACLVGGYFYVKDLGAAEVRAELEPSIAALRADLDAANATLNAERAIVAATQEVSRGLQTDLTEIRAERDRLRDIPPRVVRVRVPGPAPSASATVASRSGSAATGTLEVEGEGGSAAGLDWDIGPFLYRLADDSDQREAELAAQVRRLQEAYSVAERACQ